MILSEEVAKTKWCPEARAIVAKQTDKGRFNLDVSKIAFNAILKEPTGEQTTYGRCVASECMFWRWTMGDGFGTTTDIQTHGYCGKAGKP